MKVWVILIRAGEYAEADGVTDELCSGQVFQRLDRAKRECSTILRDDYVEDEEFSDEIEWAEVTKKNEPRRVIGRPKMNIEDTFELHQAEVV